MQKEQEEIEGNRLLLILEQDRQARKNDLSSIEVAQTVVIKRTFRHADNHKFLNN